MAPITALTAAFQLEAVPPPTATLRQATAEEEEATTADTAPQPVMPAAVAAVSTAEVAAEAEVTVVVADIANQRVPCQ